jgi:protein TonB
MEGFGPRPQRRLLPGSLGLMLSCAVHAAVLPLVAYSFGHAAPEPPDPPAIEVMLAWAPPAEETPPAPPAAAAPAAAPIALPYPPARPPARTAPAAKPVPRPVEAAAASAAPASEAAAPVASPVAPPQEAALPPPDHALLMAGYAKLILAELERHKVYPPLSLRRGEEGTVTVRLTIAEDGSLIDIAPQGEAPSRLIEASLAAVRDSGRFPPPPAGLNGAHLVFTIPIAYQLR